MISREYRIGMTDEERALHVTGKGMEPAELPWADARTQAEAYSIERIPTGDGHFFYRWTPAVRRGAEH